jgi:hypothetical protein
MRIINASGDADQGTTYQQNAFHRNLSVPIRLPALSRYIR